MAARAATMRSHIASTRAWKSCPALAAGRFVLGGQDVDPERRVGAAAHVAVVALLQAGIERDRRAGRRVHPLGGHHGAAQIARQDRRDTLGREPPGEPLGLRRCRARSAPTSGVCTMRAAFESVSPWRMRKITGSISPQSHGDTNRMGRGVRARCPLSVVRCALFDIPFQSPNERTTDNGQRPLDSPSRERTTSHPCPP